MIFSVDSQIQLIVFRFFLFLAITSQSLCLDMEAKLKENCSSVMNHFDSVLKLIQKEAILPESSWFGPDKKSNRNQIEKLVIEALEMLDIGGLTEKREHLRRIERRIVYARERISDYRKELLSAPSESWFHKTITDYQKMITMEEELVRTQQEEARKLRDEIHDLLEKTGLNLSKNQFETLITSVIGDDVLSMSAIFQNLKAISQKLSELSSESREDTGMSRKYYGMYMVSLEVLDAMYERFVRQIRSDYLPQILIYITEAQKNISQAREGISQKLGDERILLANIHANEMTIQVARSYEHYLSFQRDSILKRKEKLKKDLFTAKNTWQTVSLSHQIITLLQKSNQEFDTLISLSMPPFEVFENLEMKKAFQEITLRLKGTENK